MQVASNGLTQEVREERDEAAWAAAQPPQDIPSSPVQQQAHAISNTGEVPARITAVVSGALHSEQHCFQPEGCLLQVCLLAAVKITGRPGHLLPSLQFVFPGSSCGCLWTTDHVQHAAHLQACRGSRHCRGASQRGIVLREVEIS